MNELDHKVLKIAAQVCRMHADVAGNRICQDWSGETDVLNTLTEAERDELMSRYEQYNSGGSDFEPGYFPYDEMLISLVVARALEVITMETTATEPSAFIRIDGMDYGVPLPVVEEIEYLRRELAMGLETSDGWWKDLRECEAKLAQSLALNDELCNELEIALMLNDQLRILHKELCEQKAEVSWLRKRRESMVKTGGKLWGELHDCQDALTRLRGDSEPHESGNECLSCHRLATMTGYPFCDQCLLEAQLARALKLNDEMMTGMEIIAKLRGDE